MEICYHTVQAKLSLTNGRPETIMVEDDTPMVANLPKTFALGLLQRICFRESDVRLDTGHLSSSMALNKIAQASVLSLQLESNCGLLLAFAAGPGIPAGGPSLFRFIRAVHSRKILLCLLN